MTWISKERTRLCPSLEFVSPRYSQNYVLRVSRRNKFQNVSLQGLFFWCFWRNLYRYALVPQTSSTPQTNLSNDQAYSEPCHKAVLSHIQAYSEPCATLTYAETWHTRNPGTCITLPLLHLNVYSELCYINENLRIFRTLTYLKPNTYSEPSQRFKIEFFGKIVETIIIFPKCSIIDLWLLPEYAYLSISNH